jgi:arylsulfatase A-like enzyme
MYEESAGMPLLISYPGKIPAGTVSKNLVLNLDFAPTLLDLAGVNIPEEMQGRSLRPLITGKKPDDWRNSIYYHYYEYPHGWHNVKRHYGIRTDRYKLIHFYSDIDAWELYDLEKDPHELNNVYTNSAYVKTVEKLKRELRDLQEQYQDNF